MSINLFKEDIKLDLRTIRYTKKWLTKVAQNYNVEINEVNYIFCSDEYLHRINIEYLNHDTYTDIITFDNRENLEERIEADIFISIDRVNENALNLSINEDKELLRVMAHGLLHLIGFKDKSEIDKSKMRLAEDKALELV